jgi:hypothetical protein
MVAHGQVFDRKPGYAHCEDPNPYLGPMTSYPEVETDGRGGAAHQKGQSQIQISRYITWIDNVIMLYTGVAGEKVRADYDLHI